MTTSASAVSAASRALAFAVAGVAVAFLSSCAQEPQQLASVKVAESVACQSFARMALDTMDGMVTIAAVSDGKPSAVRTDDASSIEGFCDRVRASDGGSTLQAIGVRDGQPRTVFLEDGAAPNTARIVG